MPWSFCSLERERRAAWTLDRRQQTSLFQAEPQSGHTSYWLLPIRQLLQQTSIRNSCCKLQALSVLTRCLQIGMKLGCLWTLTWSSLTCSLVSKDPWNRLSMQNFADKWHPNYIKCRKQSTDHCYWMKMESVLVGIGVPIISPQHPSSISSTPGPVSPPSTSHQRCYAPLISYVGTLTPLTALNTQHAHQTSQNKPQY